MRQRHRVSGLVVGLATVVGSSFLSVSPVHAASAAPAAYPVTPPTVRADVLPAPQINGVVWKQVIAGGTVFAGGQFTQARPSGVPAGGNGTVARGNLLAYSLTTGALDGSFAPSFNGKVSDMAVSPDGSKLVVVGNFTQVNGQARNRVAVFNLPSRTLSTTVVPNVNGPVKGVAVTSSAILLGGTFSAINGVARVDVGSVASANGALQPFQVPIDNGSVSALVASPDGSQVVIGGTFTTVGGSGNPGYGLYRASTATGAGLPLPVNSTVRDAGSNSGILRLSSDATGFYGAGYAFHGNGGQGNAEGYFQASWSSGALVNMEDCHGDSYDVAPIGDVVYVASHHHYCGNSGGFPQTDPLTFYHSTAWTKATQGTNGFDRYGYPDHPGTPRPGILPWFPTWTTGSYTGQNQAVWSVTGNAQYVVYGGEFPKVNGIAQQGIARFAVRAMAPNKSAPLPPMGGSFTPTVTTQGSQTRVTWPAARDRDDYTLSYQLFRNGVPIYTTSQGAFFWTGQPMSYTDSGAGGTKPSYVVRAMDPDGNTLSSGPSNGGGAGAGAGGAASSPTPGMPKMPALPKMPGLKAPAMPQGQPAPASPGLGLGLPGLMP